MEDLHLEPGVHKDIPWSDYLRIPYMSPSTLKHGQRSMKRLKRAIDGELQPSAKTTAVGQTVHCLLAGEYDERIAVLPEYELSEENVTAGREKTPPEKMKTQKGDLSAAGKKWVELCREHGHSPDYYGSIVIGQERTNSKSTTFYQSAVAAFAEEHAGKDIVTTADFRTAKSVVERLQNHKHCNGLISKSVQEVTVIGNIEGVRCKTRLDGLWKEGYAYGCWDLKTTSDIAPDAFYRLCKKLGYLFQFGFHNLILQSCGVQIQQYDVIAAEVQDDFDVGVISIQPFSLLDDWADKVRDIVELYRVARGNNSWPGLYDDRGEQGVLAIPEYDMNVIGDDEMVEFKG